MPIVTQPNGYVVLSPTQFRLYADHYFAAGFCPVVARPLSPDLPLPDPLPPNAAPKEPSHPVTQLRSDKVTE